MKSILYAVIAVAFLTACHSNEKLSLNLTKGDTYNQVISSNSSVEQSFNGQQMNIQVGITGKMAYKVTDVKDSVYEMEVQYKSIGMKMQMPNGTMDYNSEKKDDQDMVSAMLGSMKNIPFHITMSKTGKIKEVKDIDHLFANMFDKYPDMPEDKKQQILGQLTQAYGEKAFKGNLEMATAIFPDSPVAKGGKWTIKTQLASTMNADMVSTYELKSSDASFNQIHGESTLKTPDQGTTMDSGFPFTYDMAGTMVSDIKTDKKTGWIVEAKIKQTLKGVAKGKDSPQMPGGLTMPMTITSEMTISEK